MKFANLAKQLGIKRFVYASTQSLYGISNSHEELDEDLSKKNPILSLCIAIIMISLAGIPPFAGFFGKFYIFIAALKSGLIYLAILGVIASVISAYYYLRIIKIMYFEEPQFSYQTNLSRIATIILFLSVIAISLFIVYPSFLIDISSEVSSSFFNFKT